MQKMMFKLCFVLVVFMFIATNVFSQTKFDYPKTKKVEQIDDYHGTKISDPFRWLEDDNSAETKAWVEAQNKVTFAYLNQIPERAKLKARLTELWNYERYSAPFEQGGKYFYTKNDGLQNQSVWYVAESVKDKGRVLFDPNKLSADGTNDFSNFFNRLNCPDFIIRRHNRNQNRIFTNRALYIFDFDDSVFVNRQISNFKAALFKILTNFFDRGMFDR